MTLQRPATTLLAALLVCGPLVGCKKDKKATTKQAKPAATAQKPVAPPAPTYSVGEQIARDAVESLLTAGRDGAPDAELESRIADVANAFGDARDDLYAPVSAQDVTFGEALLAAGEDPTTLASMNDLVLQEVGDWAFLPGRTASYRLLYSEDPRLPGWSGSAYRRAYRDWLAGVEEELDAVADAPALGRSELRPSPRRGGLPSASYRLAPDYRLSGNREQLFEQELAVYAEAARLTDDPRLRSRLEEEQRAVRELQAVDAELMAAIREEPSSLAEDRVAPADPVTPGSTSLGATDVLSGAFAR